MEAIPLFGFDARDDSVFLPLGGNRLAGGDGNEESGFGALRVEGVGDLAGFNPFIVEGCYVLFAELADCVAETTVGFLVVGGWSAGVPVSRQ